MAAATQEYTTHSSAVSEKAWAAALNRWVKVGASQVHENLRQYSPDKLIDGNRWIAGNCQTAWLDMDFGRPRTINQAIIYSNRYWQRVKQFELQPAGGRPVADLLQHDDAERRRSEIRL